VTRADRILAQLNELAEESPSTHALHRAYPGLEREIAEILPIHMQLKQLPRDVVPSATAKARLRAQVMSAAREEMAARSVRPGWYRAWENLAGALTPSSMAYALARPAAAVLAVVMTFTAAGVNTVSAAMETIPGEPLYSVKTVVEQGRLALAFTNEDKTKVHIWRSAERVREVGKMVDAGISEPALYKQVLEGYSTDVKQAQELAFASRIGEQTKQQNDMVKGNLANAKRRAPDAVKGEFDLVLGAKPVQPAVLPEPNPIVTSTTPSAPPASETPRAETPAAVTEPALTAVAPPVNPLPQKGGTVADEPQQKGAPVGQAPIPQPDEQQLPAKTGDTGPASGPVASKDAGSTPLVEPSKTEPAVAAPFTPTGGGTGLIPDKSEPTSVAPAGGIGAPKGQGSGPVQSPIGGGLGPKR